MQQFFLQDLYYKTRRIDTRDYSKEALERYKKLCTYKTLRDEGCSEATALAVIELSRATYFRYYRAYQQSGLAGLEPKSRRPHHERKAQWDKDLVQRVLQLRRQFPLWGKLKLTQLLLREYDIKVSVSKVGRILSNLLRRGLIKAVAFYYGKTKRKKARQFYGHAKRWRSGMKAKQLGELIQVDHMTVTPELGSTIKHFKAICPITKISVERAYVRASSRCAKDFLIRMLKALPFPVISLQVDGGSEFRADFEAACEALEIALFVLPPRSPECNGCIERCNGTARYEFYGTYRGPATVHAINKALVDYQDCYNGFRPHQALNQLTPMEYYQMNFAKV